MGIGQRGVLSGTLALLALSMSPGTALSAQAAAQDASAKPFLIKGIEGNVYLLVHLTDRNGTRLYCAAPGEQRHARFAVSSGSKRGLISALPISLTEWDAIFKTAYELGSDAAWSTPSRNCYVIDMTDMPKSPTASQISLTPQGEGLLLGDLKVVNIDFIEAFERTGRTGKADLRSYRVTYKIDDTGHARPFPEVEGKTFQATCTVVRHGGEQSFRLERCVPVS